MRVWGHAMASHGVHEGCDAVLVDQVLGFYAVADSRTSEAAGALGAVAALQVMHESLSQQHVVVERAHCGRVSSPTLRDAMGDAVLDAQTEILRLGAASPRLRGVQVSLAALWVMGANAYVARLGGAACYRMRDGSLSQAGERLAGVETGTRGAEVAALATGTYPRLEPIVRVDCLAHGDRFLLGTDGFVEHVQDIGALGQAVGAGLVGSLPESLLRSALAAGAPSAGVAIVQVEDVERSELPAAPLWLRDQDRRARARAH